LVPKMLLSGSGVSLAAGRCAHHPHELSFLSSSQTAAFTSALGFTHFFLFTGDH